MDARLPWRRFKLVLAHLLARGDRPLPLFVTPDIGGRMTPRLLVIHYTTGTWSSTAKAASARWRHSTSATVGPNRCGIGIEGVDAGKLGSGPAFSMAGVAAAVHGQEGVA